MARYLWVGVGGVMLAVCVLVVVAVAVAHVVEHRYPNEW